MSFPRPLPPLLPAALAALALLGDHPTGDRRIGPATPRAPVGSELPPSHVVARDLDIVPDPAAPGRLGFAARVAIRHGEAVKTPVGSYRVRVALHPLTAPAAEALRRRPLASQETGELTPERGRPRRAAFAFSYELPAGDYAARVALVWCEGGREEVVELETHNFRVD